jgi:hypothetical protein
VLAYFVRGGDLPWSLRGQKKDGKKLKRKEKEILKL